ncbi:chromosomal replication initiator protein DnaA [Sphingomonas sp.]|uniref:chromosomal replication initiator protein DnaA n=1 Tax=Sphingomonas sp. TaxID=28214 RepID=UPI0025EE9937|nr:chromosomal replication initiator protein DnaA [Sphingomonas sp.]
MAGARAVGVTNISEVGRAWARIRNGLRDSAGGRLFDQWLKPMTLIETDEADTVRLALPSAFMTNWVRNNYGERLGHEFRALVPGVLHVVIETVSAAASLPSVKAEVVSIEPSRAAASTPAAPLAARPAFDPRFTFDRFVVDASNRVAANAARALAEPGTPRFTPLFLYGGTGMGKTHLMHAIGAAYLAAVPDATVIMMSAERFMFEFVQAMRARDTFSFKARLRSADLLMIDDLHFIAGKDATQEEFFYTINEVMAAGKRIVVTADRAPQNLDGVEARIVSRFASGFVADIKPADLTLRRAILDRKLVDLPDVQVPDDVLELLAARLSNNIRELEGALNRLVAYAQLTDVAIDLDFAHATLGELLRGVQKRVTIDEIQRAVSAYFDLKPIELISARRARVVARPRQIAMYLAKRLTTRSLPEIGRKFGGRDHSTVIHAVRRIEQLRDSDGDVDTAVRRLLRDLEG